MVGRIIGKAGANIKSFQERSGAHVNIEPVGIDDSSGLVDEAVINTLSHVP